MTRTPETLRDGEIVTDLPAGPYQWSGLVPVPACGEHVNVTMNNLGPGIVRGYFLMDGTHGKTPRYLGVAVSLMDPPAWWCRQGNPTRLATVFGAEIAALKVIE